MLTVEQKRRALTLLITELDHREEFSFCVGSEDFRFVVEEVLGEDVVESAAEGKTVDKIKRRQ